MSKPPSAHVLSAAVAATLLLCGVSDTYAQSYGQSNTQQHSEERRARRAEKETGKQDPAAATAKYPQATRQDPQGKASAKLGPKLTKVFEAYEGDTPTAAVALADEIIANDKANPYERSIAARIAGTALIGSDDVKARSYLQQALEINGLGNNDHFETMWIVAQLQIQAEQYKEGLVTMDRFLSETHSQNPEHMVLKGNALYRLERYPEAVAVLKLAVAAPEPKPEWLQLLMGAYFETNQPAEAAKIAEELNGKNPNDKRLQMNLAAIYMQADQNDKAAALLEKLRAGGQLTEDKDYRNLYALYLNMEGREKEAAGVINDGLQKGVLKPDFKTYQALAQAYYFSEQPALAIDAYAKAAPLAPDGETYLNLAKALANEGRIAEARQAAQQALDKGVKKPDEARSILARAGSK